MSRFGSDPHAFFDSVYQGTVPWDVGKAQPALSVLLEDYPPQGPALDLGCGSGDLAFHLAERGLAVVGVDFAEGAIALARKKANSLPPEAARIVDFRVADALKPSRLEQKFRSVFDSGFLHLFDSSEVEPFVHELASTLHPGGRYYLLAFAVEFPVPSPRALTEDEIASQFTPRAGFRVLELRRATFESRIAPVPALCGCIERIA